MKKRILIFTDKNLTNYMKALDEVGLNFECKTNFADVNDYDGLLLPGGDDIDPKFYGQENIASENVDTEIDELTIKTIAHFVSYGKPILGICKGVQYINVYFGGTLKQDIPNHKGVAHKILIPDDSPLKERLGEEAEVNSAHHQCVDRVGEGLNVIAISEDGIVEGVYSERHKVLGVQWHPERIMEINGKTIFEMFKSML